MNITAAQVNELRQMTGAGMMDCKKALVECNGDKEAAIDFLRKKGQKIAEKRADRDAAEGCVIAKTSDDHTYGAVIMLNCETDFVAANSDFVACTKQILDFAVANRVKDLEAIKTMKIGDLTVNEIVTDLTGKTGEKVELKHLEVIEAPYVTGYNHQGNRLATLVGMNKNFEKVEEVAHEVAMQAAAMAPIAIDENDVPQEVKDREMAVAIEKTKLEMCEKAVQDALRKKGYNLYICENEEHINEGIMKHTITEEQAEDIRKIKVEVAEQKAATLQEAMIQNIAKGRLAKFFKEQTLLNQVSLLDSSKTVRQFIQDSEKDATVVAFKRVILG